MLDVVWKGCGAPWLGTCTEPPAGSTAGEQPTDQVPEKTVQLRVFNESCASSAFYSTIHTNTKSSPTIRHHGQTPKAHGPAPPDACRHVRLCSQQGGISRLLTMRWGTQTSCMGASHGGLGSAAGWPRTGWLLLIDKAFANHSVGGTEPSGSSAGAQRALSEERNRRLNSRSGRPLT